MESSRQRFKIISGLHSLLRLQFLILSGCASKFFVVFAVMIPFLFAISITADADVLRHRNYFGKNRLFRTLKTEKAQAGNTNESRRVFVRLRSKVSESNDSKAKKRRSIKGLKKEARLKAEKRRSIKELKKEARLNQQEFVKYLEEENSGQVRPFWLSNCVALTATDQEIEKLLTHPDVESIVDNVVLSIPPIIQEESVTDQTDLNLWNHSMVGLDKIKDFGLSGANIRVGHLDTGIEPDNSELAGKVSAWAEFGSDGEKIESLPHDGHYNGHGTHSASVIAGNNTGVAPGVTILSALVLNNLGSGTMEQVLAGMQWVLDPDGDPETDDGAQIVNMSWGAMGSSDVLNEAVKNMKNANVLPVGAIGNYGESTTLSPGNTPDAVGVGAVGKNSYVAWFSGGADVYWSDISVTKPNIAAPGVNIPGMGLNGEYQLMSGTSFAAPHVAGAAALLLELYPDLNLAQLSSFLYNTSLDAGDSGLDIRYGHGILNVASAVDALNLYAERINTNDLIIKTVQDNSSYTTQTFRSYFSNGENVLDGEYTETSAFYKDEEFIGLSDVNGDGFSDLVVTESRQTGSGWYDHDYLVYLSKEGNGLASYPDTWFSFSSTSSEGLKVIGLSDINGDKRSDLIYVTEQISYGKKYTVKVLLSVDDQKFVNDSSPWLEFSTLSDWQNTFYLGDMNGDGKSDILVESKNTKYTYYTPVIYYVAKSNGVQASSLSNWLVRYDIPGMTDYLLHYVKDVNGDGFDDLIFTGQEAVRGRLPIYISKSNGSSKFYKEQSWGQVYFDDTAAFSGMADLNNDGAYDLIIAHDDNYTFQCDAWLSNKQDNFLESSSGWCDIDYNSYATDIQFIGTGNVGIASWENN